MAAVASAVVAAPAVVAKTAVAAAVAAVAAAGAVAVAITVMDGSDISLNRFCLAHCERKNDPAMHMT